MSYGPPSSTRLYKYQWDEIHNPSWSLLTNFFQNEDNAAVKITPKKGTPVAIILDTVMTEGKVFVYNGTNKKMKVRFETSDTSKTKIAYQLITVVESSKTTMNYPKSGYDTLTYNQAKELTLDSIPQGKYTLVCKIGTTEYKTTFHVRKKKLEITKEQLLKIFGDKNDTARYAEVARIINAYSEAFGINTTERMAHFLGQIGAETGGLKKLKESASYSARAVAKTFPYPKYGHLFEEATLNKTTYEYIYVPIDYEETKCNGEEISRGNATFPYASASEVRNAYAEIKNDTLEVILNGNKTKVPVYKTRTDVTKENIEQKVTDKNYNSGHLRVKSKYLNSSNIFDVTYACRMGNGNVASKDGSTFLGKGFIHITGKDGYETLSKEWNKLYPNDKKEFHGKDINLLESNLEVALKAAMVYWKLNYLNQKADAGIDETSIDNVGKIVNGSGKGLPNGYEDRRTYSKSAFEILK